MSSRETTAGQLDYEAGRAAERAALVADLRQRAERERQGAANPRVLKKNRAYRTALALDLTEIAAEWERGDA